MSDTGDGAIQRPADEQAPFYFDDFFVEEGASVPAEVTIKGRTVPLRVKPGLSIEDIQAAQAAGVRRVFIPGKGVQITGIDEGAVTATLLARYIVEWPFTDKRTGRPVPITPENCRKLVAEAAQQLIQLVKATGEDAEADAPFELR